MPRGYHVPARAEAARGRAARPSNGGRHAAGISHDTPGEYAGIALRPLAGAVYCSRALRRRDAAGDLRGGPAATAGRCSGDPSRGRSPRFALAVKRYPSQPVNQEPDRTNGREAGLARGPR